MFNHHSFSSIAVSVVVVLALFFSGCSTDSETDNDTNDNNPNSSASFTSGTVSPGGTFSYTFENEAEVEYYCSIHAPDMQGKITVSSNADAVERDTVTMQGMTFVPANLTVAPNTEVIWINMADIDHTVNSGNPSNNSGDGNY